MIEYLRLRDREQIEEFLRSDSDLNVYGLGDLDDEFWPHTEWFGAVDGGVIKAVCLVFSKYDPPSFHAISEPENEELAGLVSTIANRLPDYSELHLGPAARSALDWAYELIELVDHWKMALRDRLKIESADVSDVERLDSGDVAALRDLYGAVYQGARKNVFDPSMLDSGPYFGVRDGDRIVSAAGVHVLSRRYSVAAVANVATHPDWRGQGLGLSVTARLCGELVNDADHIGLNVVQANEAAIAVYRKLGFEVVGSYAEGMMSRR